MAGGNGTGKPKYGCVRPQTAYTTVSHFVRKGMEHLINRSIAVVLPLHNPGSVDGNTDRTGSMSNVQCIIHDGQGMVIGRVDTRRYGACPVGYNIFHIFYDRCWPLRQNGSVCGAADFLLIGPLCGRLTAVGNIPWWLSYARQFGQLPFRSLAHVMEQSGQPAKRDSVGGEELRVSLDNTLKPAVCYPHMIYRVRILPQLQQQACR